MAISNYLQQVETLKINTLRKYKAVLERFLEHFANRSTIEEISAEDLNRFVIHLKNQHMASNTVIHNLIIIAQFLKRQGHQLRSTSMGLVCHNQRGMLSEGGQQIVRSSDLLRLGRRTLR